MHFSAIIPCVSIRARIMSMPNLGFGLLGHVLALRANTSYEELVVSRVRAAGAWGYRHLADALDARASGAGPPLQSQTGVELGFADTRRRGRAGCARLESGPRMCWTTGLQH
jgi:hypothetical protein